MFAVTTMIECEKKASRYSFALRERSILGGNDLTDAMDVEELIEKFLESIGALKKSKADLEKEKELQMANAVRADNLAKDWEST